MTTDQDKNKRVFPRIDSECPVLYSIGNTGKWSVAQMINFSATGILLQCNEQLLRNISITITTKPGSNRLVPEITAKGKVTRCEEIGSDKYQISCKLSKVRAN